MAFVENRIPNKQCEQEGKSKLYGQNKIGGDISIAINATIGITLKQ